MNKIAEGFQAQSAFPFKTQDAILANCLRVAGLTEIAFSPQHVYDSEILFKLGGGQRDAGPDKKTIRPSRFAGLTPIEAARKAHKEGLRGRVEYHFEHSPLLQLLLDAYADQVRIIDESDGDAGDAIRDVMRRAAGRVNAGETVMDEREALLRILCTALKLRIQYVNRWKDAMPVLLVRPLGSNPAQSSTLADGKRVQSYPGGKVVPINASDELLRKMKLL